MAKKVSEELNEWKRKIDIAKLHQEQHLVNWRYWEKIYNDQLWGGRELNANQRRSTVNDKGYIPQVNELESLVLAILPDVLYYPPVWEFIPIHADWDWSAGVWELFAAYLYRVKGLDDSLEEIVVDTLITGTGLHKSGYEYEVGDTSYQLGDATTGEPEMKEGIVFSNWVSPMNIVVDHRVKCWADIRWLAQEISVPLDEVKRNKIYSNTSDLQGTESSVSKIVSQKIRGKEFSKSKNDMVKND